VSKDNYFQSNPVFGQLLKLIDRNLVDKLSKKHKTDFACKRFFTWDHLVVMLYASVTKCENLRELVSGMQANYTKILHLGLKEIPKRSTISDANAKRSADFFEELYHNLYKSLASIIPDSRTLKSESKLLILDSTTVSLFTDVMKGAGDKASSGKAKGGAKGHVLLDADHDLPQMVHITPGASNDKIMLHKISLPPNSIIVFDRAYRNYKIWQMFTENSITYVTRTIGDETINELACNIVPAQCSEQGVITDTVIKLGSGINKNPILDARLIYYKDPESGKELKFITNNLKLKASQICLIYKRRWQIEVFFKRLKRHNPLKYFLGESENAIKIQIWCAYITDLLVRKVQLMIKKKNWTFPSIRAIIKHHAMNYFNLFEYLNNPETSLIKKEQEQVMQMKLQF
jgi:hypothetical protein